MLPRFLIKLGGENLRNEIKKQDQIKQLLRGARVKSSSCCPTCDMIFKNAAKQMKAEAEVLMSK